MNAPLRRKSGGPITLYARNLAQWRKAGAVAESRGQTLSSLIGEFIADYLQDVRECENCGRMPADVPNTIGGDTVYICARCAHIHTMNANHKD